jgi:hypothetical protein
MGLEGVAHRLKQRWFFASQKIFRPGWAGAPRNRIPTACNALFVWMRPVECALVGHGAGAAVFRNGLERDWIWIGVIKTGTLRPGPGQTKVWRGHPSSGPELAVWPVHADPG